MSKESESRLQNEVTLYTHSMYCMYSYDWISKYQINLSINNHKSDFNAWNSFVFPIWVTSIKVSIYQIALWPKNARYLVVLSIVVRLYDFSSLRDIFFRRFFFISCVFPTPWKYKCKLTWIENGKMEIICIGINTLQSPVLCVAVMVSWYAT